MLSTLEPESAYSAFNLNLVSELAPLHNGNIRMDNPGGPMPIQELVIKAGGGAVQADPSLKAKHHSNFDCEKRI